MSENELKKVLVIGLDGGTFTLLKPFIARGWLPNIAELLEAGVYGELTSTTPPLTSPAWISFACGKNPGKHGCLLFTQPDVSPGGRVSLTTAANIDSQTLWEVLSDQGKKVILVNVPMTYPPHPVNGVMITGMMTPSTAVSFTFPRDLPQRYSQLKDYQIDVGYLDQGMDMGSDAQFAASPGEFIRRLDHLRQARTEVCLALLQGEAWDFFMVVYTSLDRLSHFFWKELAELAAGGKHPAEVPNGGRLLAYFQNLDADIGRLRQAAGEHTFTLLMSDHGFGPRATRAFYLNSWLQDQGLLTRRPRQEKLASSGYWIMRLKSSSLADWVLRPLARRLPMTLRVRLRKQNVRGQVDLVDWDSSQAYTVPMASYVAGIKISNQLPFEKRQDIADRLLEELPEIVDPETQKPIIRNIFRREQLYSGPHVPSFPDLILVADEEYEVVSSLIERGYSKAMVFSIRTGDHREAGIFALSGPGIRRGSLMEEWFLPDVTATILYLLDAAIPDDLDGKVIHEALEAGFSEANPVKFRPARVPDRRFGPELEIDRDDEAIRERLRALGYLE